MCPDKADFVAAIVDRAPQAREVTPSAGRSADGCQPDASQRNTPHHWRTEGGPAEPIQYFAAATPGLRQLEVMSKLPNGLPASICPKVVEGDAGSSSYGYNPAIRALLRKLGSVLE